MIALIPCYSIGTVFFRRDWRRASGLAVGFALLVLIGSACWNVDVGGYLRSSLEMIIGYNEAMFLPFSAGTRDFLAAGLLTLAVLAAAIASLKTTEWSSWLIISPWVMLTVWLLFKNAFVRADAFHIPTLLSSLPLLLAVWSVAMRGSRIVKVLLVISVLCGAGQLEVFCFSTGSFPWTPGRYAHELWAAPWRQNGRQLGAALRADWPELILPKPARLAFGDSPVGVMPVDSSVAVLNGLNLKEPPVIQSYLAYTLWLDKQNAGFFSSIRAPEFIIYMVESSGAIDNRPAAWDESIARRALIQNYVPCVKPPLNALENMVVLRRSPGAWAYEAISTNNVTLTLDQPLNIPASTNYEFLWLEAGRTPSGKLAAFLTQPAELSVAFEYRDGTSRKYRAILPILETGVLINYRVEAPDEIRRWLSSDMTGNVTARSLRFQSGSAGAFRSPFQGKIVSYRLLPGVKNPR
jgi:hypothetical protein